MRPQIRYRELRLTMRRALAYLCVMLLLVPMLPVMAIADPGSESLQAIETTQLEISSDVVMPTSEESTRSTPKRIDLGQGSGGEEEASEPPGVMPSAKEERANAPFNACDMQDAIRAIDDVPSITGYVFGLQGRDYWNVSVWAEKVSPSWQTDCGWWVESGDTWSAHLESDGSFAFYLPPGEYRVGFGGGSSGFIEQWYNNSASFDLADTVIVSSGQTRTNVNATLELAPISVSGVVTDSSGRGLHDIHVALVEWNSGYCSYCCGDWGNWQDKVLWGVRTDSDGHFAFRGVPDGIFMAEFTSEEGEFVAAFHNNFLTWEEAAENPLVLTSGSSIDLSIQMRVAGWINGRVIDSSGRGIPEIEVYLHTSRIAEDWSRSWTWTDEDGRFSIGGLPTGDYFIGFAHWDNRFIPQYYNNQPALASATSIRVVEGATRQNVNARMLRVGERTVTFNSNQGSAVPQRLVMDGQQVGILPVPTRANHTFAGWFTAATGGSQVHSNQIVRSNLTLFARWTPVTPPAPVRHTVTFHSHGGSAVQSRQVNAGAVVGFLATPTRNNHTFAGWFTAASGGTRIDAGRVVTGNVTFHARWNPILPNRVTIGNAQSNNPLLVGRARNLSVNVLPTNAANRNVTWSSSNTRVATVNNRGQVRAVRPGTTTITVRTNAGNQVARATIRVQAAPTSINSTRNITSTRNSPRTITMRQGDTFRVPVVVRGNTNTNVTVNWRTGNARVATLVNNRASGQLSIRQNSNRMLTIRAQRPGTTNITLRTLNGRTITYRITVQRSALAVRDLRITNLPRNNTMNRGQVRNLDMQRRAVRPGSATLSGQKRWTSSRPRVATIDGAGRVTAHNRGETRITLQIGTQTHRVTLRVR